MDDYLDIMDRGEFMGSFGQLKRIFQRDRIKATWSVHGDMRRCVLRGMSMFSSRTGICFWPATGRIQQCEYLDGPPARQSPINWRKTRKISKAGTKKRWRTYSFDGLGRFSLPELAIRKATYFFEKVVYEREGLDGLDKYELAEILEKVSAIRIPKRFPKEARIVHRYSRPQGDYVGFNVTVKPVWTLSADLIRVCKYLDLCECAWSFYAEGGEFRSPISCFTQLIEGDAASVWNRSRSEAFFDRPSNFVRATLPFEPDCDGDKRIFGRKVGG